MSGRINFFCENITCVVRKKGALRKWIVQVIEKEGKCAGDINFILCDEEYLSQLNFKYLKHKTLTDILTFSTGDDEHCLSGDIFISLPRVRENAKTFKQGVETELHRVMIHGILHLAGYNDASKEEKAAMRQKENTCLDLL